MSGALTGSGGHATCQSALTDICSERGNTIRVPRAVNHRWLGHCGSLSTFTLGGGRLEEQSEPSHLFLGIFSSPLAAEAAVAAKLRGGRALTSLRASAGVKLIDWLPTTNTEPPDMTQGDQGVTV